MTFSHIHGYTTYGSRCSWRNCLRFLGVCSVESAKIAAHTVVGLHLGDFDILQPIIVEFLQGQNKQTVDFLKSARTCCYVCPQLPHYKSFKNKTRTRLSRAHTSAKATYPAKLLLLNKLHVTHYAPTRSMAMPHLTIVLSYPDPNRNIRWSGLPPKSHGSFTLPHVTFPPNFVKIVWVFFA